MPTCALPTRSAAASSRCRRSATLSTFLSPARTTPARWRWHSRSWRRRKAGKDFGALAKQYSQDPGSARNGGDLGWADRSNFVKPFADALFSMAVGDIRGPVKTQFGYHIIQLDEIQAGKGKSFEEARPELEAQLRKDRATDHFGDIQEQLQSRLQDPNADLNALAQQYHMQSGDMPSFAKGAGARAARPGPPAAGSGVRRSAAGRRQARRTGAGGRRPPGDRQDARAPQAGAASAERSARRHRHDAHQGGGHPGGAGSRRRPRAASSPAGRRSRPWPRS